MQKSRVASILPRNSRRFDGRNSVTASPMGAIPTSTTSLTTSTPKQTCAQTRATQSVSFSYSTKDTTDNEKAVISLYNDYDIYPDGSPPRVSPTVLANLKAQPNTMKHRIELNASVALVHHMLNHIENPKASTAAFDKATLRETKFCRDFNMTLEDTVMYLIARDPPTATQYAVDGNLVQNLANDQIVLNKSSKGVVPGSIDKGTLTITNEERLTGVYSFTNQVVLTHADAIHRSNPHIINPRNRFVPIGSSDAGDQPFLEPSAAVNDYDGYKDYIVAENADVALVPVLKPWTSDAFYAFVNKHRTKFLGLRIYDAAQDGVPKPRHAFLTERLDDESAAPVANEEVQRDSDSTILPLIVPVQEMSPVVTTMLDMTCHAAQVEAAEAILRRSLAERKTRLSEGGYKNRLNPYELNRMIADAFKEVRMRFSRAENLRLGTNFLQANDKNMPLSMLNNIVFSDPVQPSNSIKEVKWLPHMSRVEREAVLTNMTDLLPDNEHLALQVLRLLRGDTVTFNMLNRRAVVVREYDRLNLPIPTIVDADVLTFDTNDHRGNVYLHADNPVIHLLARLTGMSNDVFTRHCADISGIIAGQQKAKNILRSVPATALLKHDSNNERMAFPMPSEVLNKSYPMVMTIPAVITHTEYLNMVALYNVRKCNWKKLSELFKDIFVSTSTPFSTLLPRMLPAFDDYKSMAGLFWNQELDISSLEVAWLNSAAEKDYEQLCDYVRRRIFLEKCRERHVQMQQMMESSPSDWQKMVSSPRYLAMLKVRDRLIRTLKIDTQSDPAVLGMVNISQLSFFEATMGLEKLFANALPPKMLEAITKAAEFVPSTATHNTINVPSIMASINCARYDLSDNTWRQRFPNLYAAMRKMRDSGHLLDGPTLSKLLSKWLDQDSFFLTPAVQLLALHMAKHDIRYVQTSEGNTLTNLDTFTNLSSTHSALATVLGNGAGLNDDHSDAHVVSVPSALAVDPAVLEELFSALLQLNRNDLVEKMIVNLRPEIMDDVSVKTKYGLRGISEDGESTGIPNELGYIFETDATAAGNAEAASASVIVDELDAELLEVTLMYPYDPDAAAAETGEAAEVGEEEMDEPLAESHTTDERIRDPLLEENSDIPLLEEEGAIPLPKHATARSSVKNTKPVDARPHVVAKKVYANEHMDAAGSDAHAARKGHIQSDLFVTQEFDKLNAHKSNEKRVIEMKKVELSDAVRGFDTEAVPVLGGIDVTDIMSPADLLQYNESVYKDMSFRGVLANKGTVKMQLHDGIYIRTPARQKLVDGVSSRARRMVRFKRAELAQKQEDTSTTEAEAAAENTVIMEKMRQRYASILAAATAGETDIVDQAMQGWLLDHSVVSNSFNSLKAVAAIESVTATYAALLSTTMDLFLRKRQPQSAMNVLLYFSATTRAHWALKGLQHLHQHQHAHLLPLANTHIPESVPAAVDMDEVATYSSVRAHMAVETGTVDTIKAWASLCDGGVTYTGAHPDTASSIDANSVWSKAVVGTFQLLEAAERGADLSLSLSDTYTSSTATAMVDIQTGVVVGEKSTYARKAAQDFWSLQSLQWPVVLQYTYRTASALFEQGQHHTLLQFVRRVLSTVDTLSHAHKPRKDELYLPSSGLPSAHGVQSDFTTTLASLPWTPLSSALEVLVRASLDMLAMTHVPAAANGGIALPPWKDPLAVRVTPATLHSAAGALVAQNQAATSRYVMQHAPIALAAVLDVVDRQGLDIKSGFKLDLENLPPSTLVESLLYCYQLAHMYSHQLSAHHTKNLHNADAWRTVFTYNTDSVAAVLARTVGASIERVDLVQVEINLTQKYQTQIENFHAALLERLNTLCPSGSPVPSHPTDFVALLFPAVTHTLHTVATAITTHATQNHIDLNATAENTDLSELLVTLRPRAVEGLRALGLPTNPASILHFLSMARSLSPDAVRYNTSSLEWLRGHSTAPNYGFDKLKATDIYGPAVPLAPVTVGIPKLHSLLLSTLPSAHVPVKEQCKLSEANSQDLLHVAVWLAQNAHHRDAALLLQLCMMYSNLESRRYVPVFHTCLISALNSSQSTNNMWYYLRVMFSTPLAMPLHHPALAALYQQHDVHVRKDNAVSYCLPQGVMLEILMQSLAVANETQHLSHLILCFKHIEGVLTLSIVQSLRKSIKRVIDNLHSLPDASPGKVLLNDFGTWVNSIEKTLALSAAHDAEELPDANDIAELIRKAAQEANTQANAGEKKTVL